MKTQVTTFRISNTFDEWVKNFDSHLEIQVSAGMTPLYRVPHEDDPHKVCIVLQVEDDVKAAQFMQDNETSILASGHLLETTESNTYL